MPDLQYLFLADLNGAEIDVQHTPAGQDIFTQHTDVGQRLAARATLGAKLPLGAFAAS
jgi:hypothetical protein